MGKNKAHHPSTLEEQREDAVYLKPRVGLMEEMQSDNAAQGKKRNTLVSSF